MERSLAGPMEYCGGAAVSGIPGIETVLLRHSLFHRPLIPTKLRIRCRLVR